MFCPNCGTDMGDSKFCPSCGRPATSTENQTLTYEQACHSTTVLMKQFSDTVNTAYIFSLLGIFTCLFYNIGLILTIISKVKIKNLNPVDEPPADLKVFADYQLSKKRLSTAKKLNKISIILTIVEDVLALIFFILLICFGW